MGFGAALAAGAGILSDVSGAAANIYNIWNSEDTKARNEQFMREAWARDDSARQRMVTDLEKAGLSKWLATGASPSTSSPISLSPTHAEGINLDAMQHMFENKMHELMTKIADKNTQ